MQATRLLQQRAFSQLAKSESRAPSQQARYPGVSNLAASGAHLQSSRISSSHDRLIVRQADDLIPDMSSLHHHTRHRRQEWSAHESCSWRVCSCLCYLDFLLRSHLDDPKEVRLFSPDRPSSLRDQTLRATRHRCGRILSLLLLFIHARSNTLTAPLPCPRRRSFRCSSARTQICLDSERLGR